MSRFLCTGGAGFIGSHLVDLLLNKGHQVLILDAFSWGSNLKNLPATTRIIGGISGQMVNEVPDGDCVLVIGDVADARLVKQLVNLCDGVFHLAAQTHVDRSYGDILPFVNSNAVGAYAVLEAVRTARQRIRCVFVSTDEVYGDVESGFSKETDLLAPRNIYSALKAGGDLLAQTYAAIFKMDVVIARPANNYGPRQFEEKLIPKILSCFRNGPLVPIFGDGEQTRDWLYVGDTVQALLTMYEHGDAGQIYNLGAHEFRTVNQVVQTISRLVGVPWEERVTYMPDRIRGDRRYALDLGKTQADLGWFAQTKFLLGIQDTVTWYGKQ